MSFNDSVGEEKFAPIFSSDNKQQTPQSTQQILLHPFLLWTWAIFSYIPMTRDMSNPPHSMTSLHCPQPHAQRCTEWKQKELWCKEICIYRTVPFRGWGVCIPEIRNKKITFTSSFYTSRSSFSLTSVERNCWASVSYVNLKKLKSWLIQISSLRMLWHTSLYCCSPVVFCGTTESTCLSWPSVLTHVLWKFPIGGQS